MQYKYLNQALIIPKMVRALFEHLQRYKSKPTSQIEDKSHKKSGLSRSLYHHRFLVRKVNICIVSANIYKS